MPTKSLSLLLAVGSPSLSYALQAPAAAPRVSHASLSAASAAPQLPLLSALRTHRRAAAVVMEETFPTLEEELAAGTISQDEYDALVGGMEEDMEVPDAGAAEPELSAEAQKIANAMKSASGVELAPWMKVDFEDIAKAKKEREMRKVKAAAAAAGSLRTDGMSVDPQAAELGAGGGLKSDVLSEEEIELRWDTQDETGNAGFIVQRRRGGAANFEDIATYESFSPLRSKGPSGGTYVYLDDTADVGTWVYRILDCDTSGTRSAVCQKLVEVDSAAEQTQTLVVGGLIATLALVFVGAGLFIDPIQTTSKGASFF